MHLEKHLDLLDTAVLQYNYEAMFSLFQNALTHSKHIIDHVLCIPETRDIVRSWLLGSLVATTKFIRGIEFRIFTLRRKAIMHFEKCKSITQTV